jgi:hypothetical protein
MSALLRLTGVYNIKSDFQKWIHALENPDESKKRRIDWKSAIRILPYRTDNSVSSFKKEDCVWEKL